MRKRGGHRRSTGVQNGSGSCDCVELQEWALLFVEGELPDESRCQLLVHIQTCTACARLVRTLKKTVHLCRLEPGTVVPEKTHRQLWQTIRQLTTARKSRR